MTEASPGPLSIRTLRATVIEGREPVARAVSRGQSEIDVHLLSGAPDISAAAVLRAGFAAVDSPERCKLAADMTEEREVNGLRLNTRDGAAVRDRRGLSDPVRPESEIFVMQALSGG